MTILLGHRTQGGAIHQSKHYCTRKVHRRTLLAAGVHRDYTHPGPAQAVISWNRNGESSSLALNPLNYTLGMGAPLVPLDLHVSLAEYRRLLEEAFGPRLRSVRLFGSRARGDAEVDSDADVSVIVAGLSDEERGMAIDLAMSAWRNAGCRGPLISPLPWSEAEYAVRRDAERRIAMDIDREGIPL